MCWSVRRQRWSSLRALPEDWPQVSNAKTEGVSSFFFFFLLAPNPSQNVIYEETERLQQDLEKVQQLEGKIKSELGSLKERISTMESELSVYSDLDNLRHTAEDKKKVFINELRNMTVDS